jgi:hypothetical protein
MEQKKPGRRCRASTAASQEGSSFQPTLGGTRRACVGLRRSLRNATGVVVGAFSPRPLPVWSRSSRPPPSPLYLTDGGRELLLSRGTVGRRLRLCAERLARLRNGPEFTPAQHGGVKVARRWPLHWPAGRRVPRRRPVSSALGSSKNSSAAKPCLMASLKFSSDKSVHAIRGGIGGGATCRSVEVGCRPC